MDYSKWLKTVTNIVLEAELKLWIITWWQHIVATQIWVNIGSGSFFFFLNASSGLAITWTNVEFSVGSLKLTWQQFNPNPGTFRKLHKGVTRAGFF